VSTSDVIACARDGLARSPRNLTVETNRALGPLTTYRVGGAADVFVSCATDRDLDEVARVVAQ